jgi:DNA-binding transcriptional MerR regulator
MFRLEDLARAADVSARTVRYYVQRGLLPAPEFRGKDTAYGPEHLSRLRAIKRLQQERLPLEEIAARLAGASPAVIERLVDAEADCSAAVTMQAAPTTPSSGSESTAIPPLVTGGERWERFAIAPGLELHLEGGARSDVRRLAQAILTQFGRSPKT